MRARTEPITPLHVRMGSTIVGGPDRVLAALGRAERQLDLAVLDDGRTDRALLRRTFASSPVRLHRITTRGRLDPRGPARLAELALSLGAGVIHSWDYKADVIGWRAARRTDLPLVCTLHGMGGGGGRLRLYEAIDRWVLRRADVVLAVSRSLARSTKVDRVVLVPNVVEVDAAPPRAVVSRPRRLVFVGRLAPVKGLDLLLPAFAAARRQVPDLHLTVVGDGPERSTLAALAAELGVAGALEFTGWLERPTEVLDSCDLFVLPSHHEEQPVALLEAMARGLPAVVTDVGESAALVDVPATGLVVPRGDGGALAEALVEATSRSFDGRAAWSRVHADHAAHRLSALHQQEYRRAVAGRTRAISSSGEA